MKLKGNSFITTCLVVILYLLPSGKFKFYNMSESGKRKFMLLFIDYSS